PLQLRVPHSFPTRRSSDLIQTGRLATLNGSRYLLLELWHASWLPQTERVIFELQTFGIVPIIAHPERYLAIQRDPSRLAALVRQDRKSTRLNSSHRTISYA